MTSQVIVYIGQAALSLQFGIDSRRPRVYRINRVAHLDQYVATYLILICGATKLLYIQVVLASPYVC